MTGVFDPAVAPFAVALALIVRIYAVYGTLDAEVVRRVSGEERRSGGEGP